MYVCFQRFNAAKKDNDFVYHDKIAAFDTLPEIKGTLLMMFKCMLDNNIVFTVDLTYALLLSVKRRPQTDCFHPAFLSCASIFFQLYLKATVHISFFQFSFSRCSLVALFLWSCGVHCSAQQVSEQLPFLLSWSGAGSWSVLTILFLLILSRLFYY